MTKIGLTNNTLKLIAMVSMAIDHMGLVLFPSVKIFGIIGRLAFPIFAYMIAEGFSHTRNKFKYFMGIFTLGLACQAVYFITSGSLYLNILLTFSLSVLAMLCFDFLKRKITVLSVAVTAVTLCSIVFISAVMPTLVRGFMLDYGFIGVMIPFFVYLMPRKPEKIFACFVLLIALAAVSQERQWFGLLALPFLILYNGKRGKYRLKYLFYIFYPTHFAVIYLIDLFI